MAGTIPLSMTQQFDQYGEPLDGGKLYFIVAGTVSTPQNAFQDIALALPHPNPITLDAAGRVPQLFLADGLIKIRLTDADGAVQLAADNVQVIGSSSGGGGGGSVDATTVLQTGDIKVRYGVGSHSGWVRANGRTIGSSISGGTERANADTQVLFEFLWGMDTNLAVVGGRGASAAADWNANKQLTLPDWRGRALAGMDDMGNAAAGRLTAGANGFGTSAIVLGAAAGAESHVLTQPQLPSVTLATAIAAGQGSHVHPSSRPTGGQATGGDVQTGTCFPSSGIASTVAATLPEMSGTTPLGGTNTAHNNVPPTMLATIYIKL